MDLGGRIRCLGVCVDFVLTCRRCAWLVEGVGVKRMSERKWKRNCSWRICWASFVRSKQSKQLIRQTPCWRHTARSVTGLRCTYTRHSHQQRRRRKKRGGKRLRTEDEELHREESERERENHEKRRTDERRRRTWEAREEKEIADNSRRRSTILRRTASIVTWSKIEKLKAIHEEKERRSKTTAT